MGFNKKFVDKKSITESVNSGFPISKIFDADAFIFMDEFSSKIFKLYKQGVTEQEIIQTINGEKYHN